MTTLAKSGPQGEGRTAEVRPNGGWSHGPHQSLKNSSGSVRRPSSPANLLVPNSQGLGASEGYVLTRDRDAGERPSSAMNFCMSSICLLAMPSHGEGWISPRASRREIVLGHELTARAAPPFG